MNDEKGVIYICTMRTKETDTFTPQRSFFQALYFESGDIDEDAVKLSALKSPPAPEPSGTNRENWNGMVYKPFEPKKLEEARMGGQLFRCELRPRTTENNANKENTIIVSWMIDDRADHKETTYGAQVGWATFTSNKPSDRLPELIPVYRSDSRRMCLEDVTYDVEGIGNEIQGFSGKLTKKGLQRHREFCITHKSHDHWKPYPRPPKPKTDPPKPKPVPPKPTS